MIYYTIHAKARMIFRGITEEMVKSALAKPDEVGFGYDGKSLVFKKFSKGTVKIVFAKRKGSVIIVSVIWEIIKKN
jgi:hypothetical protein